MDETSAIGNFRTTAEPPEAEAVGTRNKTHGLDSIVSAHQQQVARMAHRLLGTREGVEDVVQEVFLAALANIDRFRGDSSISTWLTAVTVNKCRSLIRRRMIRRRLFPLSGREPLEEQADNSPDTHNANEVSEEVRRVVYRMPRKYREPVVLRYFESMSIDEIAQALGLAANTVEVRLSRARKKLKVSLTDRLMK